jgi:putative ABC transport system substrate-binding protein
MRRRAFILLGCGAAAMRPLAVLSQQNSTPVIGFLNSASPGAFAPFVGAFKDSLKQAGFVEGQNVRIEYRWAYGKYDQLEELAKELTLKGVTVIAATGGDASAAAAKLATEAIPVVFSISGDPVQTGLVASLHRPGGNLTGRTNFGSEITLKRLQLLRELLPGLRHAAVLVNPEYPLTKHELREIETHAPEIGVRVSRLNARTQNELEAAFASLPSLRAEALLVQNEPYFLNQRTQIVALAARYATPTMYHRREIAQVGGLISYGSSLLEAYQQVGVYVARILKGERPSDLPVLQPTTLELVINLRTARELGVPIPPTLLARADEVIE